jgi:hypothetical protein
MPDEEIAQSSETEGLEAVEGVDGDEIGLAPDFFQNADAETSDSDTETDDGLSQESEQSGGEEDVAADATESTPAADDAQASQTPETPATESFYKYGDTEFKSPDDVGNFIKSVEGRQRNTQINEKDALQKNAAWNDWSRDPAKLRARLAELEGGDAQDVVVGDEKKTFLSDTDWKSLTNLVDKGRGMEALAQMAHMYDKVMDSRLGQMEAKLSASIQPLTDQQVAKEATVSLFTQAENVTDNDGNLIWPEFNPRSEKYDDQFIQVFTQVWQQLPANIAWDENMHGIEVAYNRTKQFLAGRETATEPAAEGATESKPSGASTQLRNAQGQFVKQTEDAATAVGGSGASPPPSAGPADSYSEAAILRGMDAAHEDRDPVFGVRR